MATEFTSSIEFFLQVEDGPLPLDNSIDFVMNPIILDEHEDSDFCPLTWDTWDYVFWENATNFWNCGGNSGFALLPLFLKGAGKSSTNDFINLYLNAGEAGSLDLFLCAPPLVEDNSFTMIMPSNISLGQAITFVMPSIVVEQNLLLYVNGW